MRCNIWLTLSHQASASSSCILQQTRVFLARACATCARSKAVPDVAETAGVRGCGPDAKLKTTEDGETMLLPIMRGEYIKVTAGTLQGKRAHVHGRRCRGNTFHEVGELNVGWNVSTSADLSARHLWCVWGESREAKGATSASQAWTAEAASCGFYATVESTDAQAHPQKPPRSHPDCWRNALGLNELVGSERKES